jgi:hypothetical protein
MSTSMHNVHTRRPWGIWLISIAHTLYALNGVFQVAPSFRDPVPHGWSPTATVWAPYVVALFLTMLAATWAVWAGYRHARAALLITLATAICLNIPDVLFAVPYLIEGATKDPEQWSSVSFWWALTFGFWLVLWAAIEAWYLFSSRTRQFFEVTRVL